MRQSTTRLKHFEANLPLWCALHHYLPAHLLREMCCAFAMKVAPDGPGLDDLFEEVAPRPGATEAWYVRPRTVSSDLAFYLQGRIRSIIWRGDLGRGLVRQGAEARASDNTAALVRALEEALLAGRQDLVGLSSMSDETLADKGLKALIGAAKTLVNLDDELSDLPPALVPSASAPKPLYGLMLKHLGDLCANADRWHLAFAFYRHAGDTFDADDSRGWEGLITPMRAIVGQSKAAAQRTLVGPKEALASLQALLDDKTLQEAPVLVSNTSVDIIVAASLVEGPFGADRRVDILAPPQLLQTLEPSPGLEERDTRHFDEARRRFWATLRRQVALGSATASRTTKAQFAIGILEGLETTMRDRREPASFLAAVLLLVESGMRDRCDRFTWSEAMVRAYVNEAIIDEVTLHTKRYSGTRAERTKIAVVLFRNWILALTPDRQNLAKNMLMFVADVVEHSADVAYDGLEALQVVAEKRPQYRRGAADFIIDALLSKVTQEGSWRDKVEALKAISAFLAVLDEATLRRVIETTLSLLAGFDPFNVSWHVVRPPMEMLTSRPSVALAARDPNLGHRILEEIIRFGLGQESEHARLLFNLQNFDASTLSNDKIIGRVRTVIPAIVRRANDINASDAVGNICALLLAPTLVGRDGIEAALQSLLEIVRSGLERPCLSFSWASQALSLLADQRPKIALAMKMDLSEFDERLHPLLDLIVAAWRHAAIRPQIFASFALPPTPTPNPTAVHNWVFASLAFAEKLDEMRQMTAAIDVAARDAQLKDAIARARATRMMDKAALDFDAATVASEDRETFYTALAQRLVALRKERPDVRRQVLRELLIQCFRQGPRGLDGSLFVMALEADVGINDSMADLPDYRIRLDNDRELRLQLTPFLEHLTKRDAQNPPDRVSADNR